jgi:branched-chain amino acid aminotransferase
MMRQAFPRAGALIRGPAASSTRRTAALWQLSRQYSIKPAAAATSKPLDLDPSKLTIEKTVKPSKLTKPEDLIFGRTFTGSPRPFPFPSPLPAPRSSC